MTAPRICVQCMHYHLHRGSPPGSEHRCNRPETDVVTGKETRRDAICSVERGHVEDCGPEGRFWESRA